MATFRFSDTAKLQKNYFHVDSITGDTSDVIATEINGSGALHYGIWQLLFAPQEIAGSEQKHLFAPSTLHLFGTRY